MKSFPGGSRIRVLRTKLFPEYEGREGVVVGPTSGTGQVPVMLDGDDRVSFWYASTDLVTLPTGNDREEKQRT